MRFDKAFICGRHYKKFFSIFYLSLLICLLVTESRAAEADFRQALIIAEEMRSSYRDMIPLAGVGEEVACVDDIKIQAQTPDRTIPLRVYHPIKKKEQGNTPVFIFMHGGGFVSGDLQTHDVLLRAIANGAECIVVSVDYRLAPEHPFPAGLEDLYATLLWVHKNAASFGGGSGKIAVGGDSAGGNLAVALSILTRDRKGPEIAGQWLMYPTLSNKMDTESWSELGDKYFPTRDVNVAVISAYVPEGKSPYEPLIAPLWADLQNLPEAFVQIGGLDPLSDECKDFVRKMKNSGNNAQLILYPKFQHGFLQFYQDEENFPDAGSALDSGLKWLRGILYP